MIQIEFRPGFRTTSIKEAAVDAQRELDLNHERIKLAALQIARLQVLPYRDCPKQTLPPLPSLQQPLFLKRANGEQ